MDYNKIQMSIFNPNVHDKLTYKEKKYKLLYGLAHLYFITHNKGFKNMGNKDMIKAYKKLVKESWKHANTLVKKHKDILKLIKK